MRNVISASLAAIACHVLACVSVEDLDRDRFPLGEESGYSDRVAQEVRGLPSVDAGVGGSQSAPGAGGTGSDSMPADEGGGAGLGMGAAGGADGLMMAPAAEDGCDALAIFAASGSEGGCGDSGCHVAGGAFPDLVTPGVEQRLLNSVSSICGARPFLESGGGFLGEKISDSVSDGCGSLMPLGQPDALGEADRQCILDWIDELAASGG